MPMIGMRNLTRERIQQKTLQELAGRILKKEKKEGKDLSVVVVGSAKMRELSRIYRGKDKAANVLSFPFDDVYSERSRAAQGKPGGEFSLGEIVLCPSVIRKDAVEYRIPFQRALSWMLVHGLLHLLGYSHETPQKEIVMSKKEQQYLS